MAPGRPSLLVFTLLALVACKSSSSSAPPVDSSEALLGGDGTIFDEGDEAFAYPARNLGTDKRGPFQLGDGVFNRNWVPAPAAPQGNDGLGPTYNAVSCSTCHASNGRGAPPDAENPAFLGLLFRLSVPGQGPHGGPAPDPNYGDQLQPYGIFGVQGEGTPAVTYEEVPGTYADGAPYSLRKPTYTIGALSFGPLAAGVMISPRLAPQTVGLGLLQAVDEATILGFAAQNGGKANYVWDERAQKTALGRFGWKANQPTLEQQTLGAARNDLGITNSLFPTEDCEAPNVACKNAPHSLSDPNLQPLAENALVVHAYGLAVPARRNLGAADTSRGEALFSQAGCATCHVPTITTGQLAGWAEMSAQTIHPYTDLLLHDMGPDLADNRPDYLASGSEWRTPPLWALGLVEPIEGKIYLMHDGRARGFEEAILWHGGQGAAAKEAFRAMSKGDRDALLAFLSSL